MSQENSPNEEYVCKKCNTRCSDQKSIEHHNTTPLSGLDTKLGAIFKVTPAVYYSMDSIGILVITGIKTPEDHNVRQIGRTLSIDLQLMNIIYEEDHPHYAPNLTRSNELSQEEYEIALELIHPYVRKISSKIEISKGIVKLL